MFNLFKRKIYITQFIADIIRYRCDFLENNFDKLVELADEFKVLSPNDKEDLLEKTHALMIVDTIMGCNQNFYEKMNTEEVGSVVGSVYTKYIVECKNKPKSLAEKRIDQAIELFSFVESAENSPHNLNMGDDEIKNQKFYLCKGFSDFFAGTDVKALNFQGRSFASFKLAKAFVKTDIVSTLLKEVTVTWS